MKRSTKTKKKVLPVLEAGQSTPDGELAQLHETFINEFEVVFDPYDVEVNEDTITERRVREGNMVIRGTFQYEGKKNANKRVYPRGLWERQLSPNSDLMRRIAERRSYGQIEHPENGVGSLKEAAILVTSLKLGEVEKDGSREVIGEAEILNTPSGHIVRQLARDRVKFGVSSRAIGAVNAQGMVDEKTFRPETWDVVGNPSTPNAFPNVVEGRSGGVNESCVEFKSRAGRLDCVISDKSGQVTRVIDGEKRMAGNKSYEVTSRLIESIIARPIDESNATEIDRALEEASCTLNSLVEEDSTLRDNVEVLQERIREHRQKTRVSDNAVSENNVTPEKFAKACELLRRTSVQLEEQAARIRELEEEAAATDESVVNLTQELAERDEEIEHLIERCAVSDSMLQRSTAPVAEIAEPVAEMVEEVLEAHPNLECMRVHLQRCTSVDEVKALVEAVAPATNKSSLTRRNDLPVLNEATASSAARTNKPADKTEPRQLSESVSTASNMMRRMRINVG